MAELVEGEIDTDKQALGDATFGKIFFTPEGYADPLPLYRTMLDEAPVHVSALGGVVFSEYDTSRAILRDGRFGNGDPGNRRGPFGEGDAELRAIRDKMLDEQRNHAQSMLGLDPPDHTRQRSLVSRAFTPRTVEKLRPRVAELVDGCLTEMAEAGTCDVMESLAKPLPVSVISEMLGVPRADWPEIREPVTDLVASLEPAATVPELELAMDARHVLRDYFTSLIAIRRADPQDDLLSGLIAARDDHDQLSESEILAVAVLLFAAGAETTTNLIGNGVNQLLNHPEQMERLWSDPSLVPSAVEEILRFDSPVQLDGRACLVPGEFGGIRFDEGDRVITLLGAANHDSKHFERPDDFDIARYADADKNGEGPAEPVMSFGSGIHYCLGANLAKLEGQEVFAGLIRHFVRIDEAGERPYRQRMVLRGLEACPVAVTPR